jgi:hypothetical protein
MQFSSSLKVRFVMVVAGMLPAACSSGGSSNTAVPASSPALVVAPTTLGPATLVSFGEPNIAAPTAASLGGIAPLMASSTTPTLANAPTGTVFPLNHSELISDPFERQVTGSANSYGVTLTFLGNKQVNGASIATFEFKEANIDVTLTADGIAGIIPNSGYTQIGLTTSNLNYTMLASWVTPSNNGLNVSVAGFGVSGFQTPGSALPTSGTATYTGTGSATAIAVVPSGFASVKGDTSINVNFGTGSLSGSLTNMTASAGPAASPWNNVSLTGSLSGATFSGSTAATPAPSGAFSFGANATGTFNGAFYGPNGQELGAVWSLHDSAGGGSSALGLIGATKQ